MSGYGCVVNKYEVDLPSLSDSEESSGEPLSQENDLSASENEPAASEKSITNPSEPAMNSKNPTSTVSIQHNPHPQARARAQIAPMPNPAHFSHQENWLSSQSRNEEHNFEYFEEDPLLSPASACLFEEAETQQQLPYSPKKTALTGSVATFDDFLIVSVSNDSLGGINPSDLHRPSEGGQHDHDAAHPIETASEFKIDRAHERIRNLAVGAPSPGPTLPQHVSIATKNEEIPEGHSNQDEPNLSVQDDDDDTSQHSASETELDTVDIEKQNIRSIDNLMQSQVSHHFPTWFENDSGLASRMTEIKIETFGKLWKKLHLIKNEITASGLLKSHIFRASADMKMKVRARRIINAKQVVEILEKFEKEGLLTLIQHENPKSATTASATASATSASITASDFQLKSQENPPSESSEQLTTPPDPSKANELVKEDPQCQKRYRVSDSGRLVGAKLLF